MEKLTKEQLIAEVMYLSVLAQYKAEKCVFVDFSGHVDRLTIKICESKDDWRKEIAVGDLYVSPTLWDGITAKAIEEQESDIIDRLAGIKSTLVNILDNGKIDYDDLDEYTVEVTKYRL